jgi:hypothetical protein
VGGPERAQARRDQIDADLKRAGEHNRAVFEAEANNKRRAPRRTP